MFMAVVLLVRTHPPPAPDLKPADGAVSTADVPPAAAQPQSSTPLGRALTTLRGACAALALANGALGLALHVSAARGLD